jgi:hypothetical protein
LITIVAIITSNRSRSSARSAFASALTLPM